MDFGRKKERGKLKHPKVVPHFLFLAKLCPKRIGKETTLDGSSCFLLRLQGEDTCMVLGKRLVKKKKKSLQSELLIVASKGKKYSEDILF